MHQVRFNATGLGGRDILTVAEDHGPLVGTLHGVDVMLEADAGSAAGSV